MDQKCQDAQRKPVSEPAVLLHRKLLEIVREWLTVIHAAKHANAMSADAEDVQVVADT